MANKKNPIPNSAAYLQFVVEQLRSAGLKRPSINAYVADVKRFELDVGKDLLEVKADDVYRVVELWKTDTSASSIQRRASSLRQFYNLLFMAGLISVRPTANLHVPKSRKRAYTPIPEDLERVIAAIGSTSPF